MKLVQVRLGSDHELILADAAAPEPNVDEAVVQVAASSVNRGEIALIEIRGAGWTPGQDVAGVVVRAAADGSGPAVGSRVIGLAEQGAWSSMVAVRADRLAVVPPAVALVDAAAIPMAGLTALRTLRKQADVVGRHLLITGATGGVGRFQVQLAALAGARVTAVSRSGAAVPAAWRTVAAPADAGPVDGVLDSVGGAVLRAALGVLRPGGAIVWFGSTTGEPTPLSIYDFIGHEDARLLTYFSYHADTTRDADDLTTLLSLAADGRLDLGVADRVPLADVATATARLAAGSTNGKILLTL